MKKFIKNLIVTLVVIWAIVVGVYLAGTNYYTKNVIKRPFKVTAENGTLKVNKGDSLNAVINRLANDGKLKNTHLIKYHVKSNSITANVKTGSYTITPETSFDEFLKLLESGTGEVAVDTIKVTIPEGFDVERIGQTLQDKGIVSKEEFIRGCKEYTLPSYAKNDPKRKYLLEGYLFPDTYEFKKGMTGKQVVDTMVKRFEYVINDIQKKKTISITKDQMDQIITMASIIEREVVKAEEREIVSSVFYNRLNKKMKLESCATVLYALGKHKDTITIDDTKVQSPYNTYLVAALPQGPICSPGRASIEAALQPKDTDYLFFVSKNDGTHVFSTNQNDHDAAVRKYQSGK